MRASRPGFSYRPFGKRMVHCVAALVVVAACAAPTASATIGVAYWKTVENLDQGQGSWMKWIPNGTPLNALTIPGTHDSVSLNGGSSTQTQTLCVKGATNPCDVKPQLEAGIRYFDLRADCVNNGRYGSDFLELYHGRTDQLTTLEKVARRIHDWLDDHK